MQYREFGRTGIQVSAVGMGANRFRIDSDVTAADMEKCAELVVQAAKAGVNFFDSASTYSSGKCEEILKYALPRIISKCYICGKSSSYQDKTRDSILRHIETSLKNIGIDAFDFYYMWSIKSYAQYEFIMSNGGPYHGLLAAKEQGMIRHICFSSHAPAKDAVKIILDGAFEGILVSYSLLNFRENEIVLNTAKENGLGVAVMNPLGGGIIPQNPEMFTGAFIDGDRDIIDSSLKFIYANQAVNTVLCGVSTQCELDTDIRSLSLKDKKADLRKFHVLNHLEVFQEFCTGCNYCRNCPADIPISKLMTAYNQTKFKSDISIFNRTSPELIKRTNFFRKLDGVVEFHDAVNPCIQCGRCERICTQSLSVIKTVNEIYAWVDECCVSTAGRRERLQSLIHSNFKRVGFYTAGVYTSFVISLYRKILGNYTFEVFVFDSNPLKWDSNYLDELTVRSPAEIPQLELDVLLISNYIHSEEIYDDLIIQFPTVNIQKLHMDKDVPWMF